MGIMIKMLYIFAGLLDVIFNIFKYFIFLILLIVVLHFVILILFVISTVKCILNFGKGLKGLIAKNKRKNDDSDFNDIQLTDS